MKLKDKVYYLKDKRDLGEGVITKIIQDYKGTRIYLDDSTGNYFTPEQLTKNKSSIENALANYYVNKILQLETVDFKEISERIWR